MAVDAAAWGPPPPNLTPTTIPSTMTPPSNTSNAMTSPRAKSLVVNKPSTRSPNKEPYLFDQMGPDIVLCRVGQGDKVRSFHVHKKIICAKVLYFEKLFNGPFAEGISQTAECPEDDPTTFGLLVSWIYTDVVEKPHDPGTFPEEIHKGSKQIMALFALAEKYNIGRRLQDQAMDRLIESLRNRSQWPTPQVMSAAYGWTHENSKLRLFIARQYVQIFLAADGTRKLSASFDDVPMRVELTKNDDFFNDVFTMLRANATKKPRDPVTMPACDYHQHSSTEPCPYKK